MEDTRVFLRPPVWLPLAVVIIGGMFYISGKNIEADSAPGEQGSITVTGEGRAFAVPDIAELTVGVQTPRLDTAAAAMEKLKSDMEKILDAVKDEGIEDKDIRTQSFNLNPQYDYQNGRQIPRGFQARQSIRIKVRDLDTVSAVLGAATAAGANQAGGVNFTVDDPEAKRAEAREEAIKEAKDKARELARQLGVELGDIMGFYENQGGYPTPMYYDRFAVGAAMSEDAAVEQAVPLPSGEQEVAVNVSITYKLQD